MIQPTYQQPSMKVERRRYVCHICGEARIIETRPIEKTVAVCLHPDNRGGVLPVLQLREEGALVQ